MCEGANGEGRSLRTPERMCGESSTHPNTVGGQRLGPLYRLECTLIAADDRASAGGGRGSCRRSRTAADR